MLAIKRIKFKNLLQYGNTPTEICFDKLSYPTGIVGSNGVGKSTLCTALTYGLFGKPYIKVNKGSIINSVNNKDLVVEVEFEVQGKWYKIERGQKPSILNIYDETGIFDQESSNKNIQTRIEKEILGMNFETFVQVSIMSSTNFVSFMRMPAAQRRTIMEDILGLGVFSQMNYLLKHRAKLKRNIVDKAERDLEVAVSKKKFMEDIISSTQDDAIRQKKITLKNEIDRVKKDLIELTEYEDIPEKKSYPTLEQDKLRVYRSRIVAGTASIADHIKFFENNTICPTCSQDLSEKTREDKINEYENKNRGLESALSDIEKAEMSLKEKNNEITLFNDNIDNRLESKRKIQLSISYSKKIIESITKELQKTETPQSMNSLIEMEEEIKKLEDDYNSENYVLRVKQASLKLLTDEGCKSIIVEHYLPLINKYIAKYLDMFDFPISFELDKDFNEEIKSRYIDSFSYHNFSAGQRARIDLALLLMFREVSKVRNSTSTNIAIFDELFEGSLDIEGLSVVRKVLASLAHEGEQVIVISHNENMKDTFNSRIVVSKRGMFSHLEVEE